MIGWSISEQQVTAPRMILSRVVLPVQKFAFGALAEHIRRQPASKERTTFAWNVAVGPAVAKATTAELRQGILEVRARDPRWAHEVERARELILERVRLFLGSEPLRDMNVTIQLGR